MQIKGMTHSMTLLLLYSLNEVRFNNCMFIINRFLYYKTKFPSRQPLGSDLKPWSRPRLPFVRSSATRKCLRVGQ